MLLHSFVVALTLLMSVSADTQASAAPVPVAPDAAPRLGVLIPTGPADYAVILDVFQQSNLEHDGPFEYRVGTLYGVPVVLNIAPADGVLVRSLAAQEMLHLFNIRALLYPSTSGGHLPPTEMQVGDIVLGARHVDFGNFFMNKSGGIEAGAFTGVQPDIKHFGALYPDPTLLRYLACSATRVAAHTELPAWVNAATGRNRPDVFYYGIQGTSTIWSVDKTYIEKTMRVFHEIDQDGDWYSNLVATLYHVPFIEASVIANSIYEYPDTERGLPNSPSASEPKSNVVAQRLSNRVALDFIRHYGQQVLKGSYTTPLQDPFPSIAYDTPKKPRGLLAGQDCK